MKRNGNNRKDISLIHLGLPLPRVDENIINKPPPLGVLYVAAALEKEGYSVDVNDYQLTRNKELWSINEFVNEYLKDSADVVGFSCMAGMLPFLLTLIQSARPLYPDKIFVLGGPGVTNVADSILKAFPSVDIIVRGEGENTIVEIMKNPARKNWVNIRGISYRSNDGVHTNRDRERICDLNGLAFPSYHLLPMERYYYCNVVTARGCAFNCAFCEAPSLWLNKIRFRNIENVLDEIELLHYKYGKRIINICDDTFLTMPERVYHFCGGLRERNITIQWDCFARLDQLDDNIMQEMSINGCRAVFIGVETGSDKIARQINKKIDIKQASSVVSKALNYFPRVIVSLIWGFPFESLDDFQKTVSYCQELSKLGAQVQRPLLSLRPGTPLYDTYKDQLKYDEDAPIHLSEIPINKMPHEHRRIVQNNKDIFSGFYAVEHNGLSDKLFCAKAIGMC